jgi:hypothetical protein
MAQERRMNLFTHQLGKFRVRCPYKDESTAKELLDGFLKTVLYQGFKIKKFDPKTVDLPTVNGVGYKFGDDLVTAFSDGDEVLFLNEEQLKQAAMKIGSETPEA